MLTNNGKKGGNLVGKPHKDKSGRDVGGIKAVVTDANNRPVELEGGEVIINKEASKKHWRELSRINQSAGNGVPISKPIDPHDEDPQEYSKGGKIEFNPNQLPNKWILNYAENIRKKYPEVWKLGGNIYGNQAFINLKRVSERGYWLDSEEWFYIKWRSFVARHKGDFRIAGVIAMLKWVDKVDKGWAYMKNLIDEEIQKRYSKKKENGAKVKMSNGGELAKGIKTEMEHKSTIEKYKQKKVKIKDVAKSIAKDHLKEDPKYYTHLAKVENKVRKPSKSNLAKGGQITNQEKEKYARIGISDKYDVEALNELGASNLLSSSLAFKKEERLKAIEQAWNDLLDSTEKYLVTEDSNAITQTIQNEINAKYNDGASDDDLKKYESILTNPRERKRYIDNFNQTQRKTIGEWAIYLRQSDYPIAFKYLMYKAVLNFNYDFKTDTLIKRTSKTIRNFTPFDAGTLSVVFTNQSNYLLKDYVIYLYETSARIVGSKEIAKTSGGGKWLKFEGGSNISREQKNKNATELSALVQDTYWCTKTLALNQLSEGDFYVYVTESNGKFFPRIAIRMEGESVGEVRGNASSAQDIEPEMLPIAESFLENNIPNNSGRKWLDSIRYNQKAILLYEKFKQNEYTEEIINEFLRLKSQENKFLLDYADRNGHIERIEKYLPTFFKENKVKFSENEIIYTESDLTLNFSPSKTKIILCDCIFSKYNNFPTNLGNVEIIFGFANFEGSQVKSLGNLQSIGGFANFEGSQVKSLGNLQSIGNDAYFNDSQVKSLGNLQSIGGDTYFNDSQITSLDNLQTIGGNVRFQNSQFESLGNLQSIGGNAYFDRSQVKSLGNLQSIGDNAYFQNSQFTSLGNLQSIGGNAIFKASQIKLLGNLQSIGRNADFRFSQITSLGNLQSIGGDAKFEYAKVTSLGNLQSIGGTAYFQRSQVESLGNLQTIRGDTFFGYSQIKSLGNLQTIGGDAFFGESQIKSLGNLQTIGGDANFINSQIKSLGNLQTIGGDGRFDDKKLAKEFTILKTKPNIRKELNYAKGGQTPQQSKKISKVMSEFNSGTLKTPQGKRVTNRKQAVAIALSEAGLSKYAEGGSMPTQPTQQQEPNYVSLFYNYLEKQKLTLTERDLVTRREAVSDWALGYIIYLLDESEYLLNYISKRVDFGNAKEIQKYQFIKGFITRYLTKNASFFTNEKYSEQYKNLKFTYFLWLEYYSSLLTEFSSDINLSIIEAISSRYFQAGKEEFNLTDDIDPYELFFAMINGAMWESRRMLLNAKNETQYAEQIYEYKILLNAIPDTSFETKKILTDRIKQIGDAHKEAVLFDAKTYFNVYCNTICVSNELREKNRFLREFFGAKNRQDINSENFKSWFGNSKVSENGIPLEVYHGTSHNEFTKWNMNLFPIAYFAENEDYSKFFQGNEGTMYKCYLRVQNPIDLRLFGTELVKYEEFVGYMKLKYGYELPFQPMLKAVSDARGGLWAWVYLRNGVNWLNHIKNEGYFDGFKYYENNPQDIVNGVERVTPAWAVFYPNQIKMAHGNALFNNTSDDIRFEEGGLLGE